MLKLVVAAIGLGALLALAEVGATPVLPTERLVRIEERSFAFSPSVIRVNRGDRVVFELESTDVAHGIRLDGYELEADSEPGRDGRLEFVADRLGKFKYRCSLPCGPFHPFMVGELVVEPNLPYRGGLIASLFAAAGAVVYVWRAGVPGRAIPQVPPTDSRRFELTRWPIVGRLLRRRELQPFLTIAMLFGFVLVVLAGLLGTPAGSSNFAIVFVWIVWFALLKIVLVPLGGRAWCSVCPIPAPGEWLQRRSIVVKSANRPFTLGWKWPRRLDNGWLQNAMLVAVTAFSPVILTVPLATGIILLAFIVLAVVLSLLFERRVFCRYVCPVGGFIGLYSLVAPLELRVKSAEVCAGHHEKQCYLGSDDGYGCPWMVKPWRLARNTHCGLCTECVKTCPRDNISVAIRPFGADLWVKAERRLDEAFTALIMVAGALLYSAVFLGPWAWLKDWAAASAPASRAGYVGAFLAASLVVVPGLFLLAVWTGRSLGGGEHRLGLRQAFTHCAYALVPLGLAMWAAFSLSFVLVNGSYAVSVVSDPFGWGWDLFGTASYPRTPLLLGIAPYLEAAIMVVGLALSIRTAGRIIREEAVEGGRVVLLLLPIAAFLTTLAVAFMRLYLG